MTSSITKSAFARDWRNRRIAHSDLALALDHPGQWIIRGLVATMLAVLLALATLFWEDVPVFGGLDVKKVALTVVRPLRVLHSGAIGDYVTWITFGTAVIGVAFAWLLR